MRSLPRSFIRRNSGAALLLLLTTLIFTLCLCLGSVPLSPREAVRALFSADRQGLAARIVWYVRLPRALACLTAGMAFSVSGVIVQTVLCNPLASPHVIGVNAGAGLAVTLVLAISPLAVRAVPLAAFAGAMLATGLILLLARSGAASRLMLVLAGVMLSALLNAGIEAVLAFAPGAVSAYADFRIGSFANVTFVRLTPVLPPCLALTALAIFGSEPLEVLSLGSESAQALGLRVQLMQAAMLLIASALAGMAVSVCGLLGFVGLIVPHAVRTVCKGGTRRLLVYSAVGGAGFTALCDLLGRLLFAPYELPVGVVLSFVGAPLFLHLILRQRREASHA